MSDRYDKTLLTAVQVAAFLGMKPRAVYDYCRRGIIPHIRFGDFLRFDPEAIDHFLKMSERNSNRPELNPVIASGRLD